MGCMCVYVCVSERKRGAHRTDGKEREAEGKRQTRDEWPSSETQKDMKNLEKMAWR